MLADEGLKRYIDQLPVIDTHEHLENEWMQPQWNVLSDYTRHYFVCDLISSGLDPAEIERLSNPKVDILSKWSVLEEYWEACRYTGYGQMLDIAVQKLYGVDRLDRHTVEQVEAGFQKLRATPGFSRHILKDVCHIEHIMDNIWHLKGDSDHGLYWFVTQIDDWISPKEEWLTFYKQQHSLPSTVDGWIQTCLQTLWDDLHIRNAKALKLAIAYRRTLLFEQVSHADAQKSYEQWLKGERNFAVIKPMQDYIAHAIFRWANEQKLLMQIHTGYQEGNDGYMPDTDPSHLINVILQYPDIHFDLFHMGFPYQGKIGAMGKQFPNVYLDLCWTHILSPIATQNTLNEWIQQVPLNKIFAFGGDCLFYDGVVGHLELAKRCVTNVLTAKVKDGLWGWKEAERAAEMLFYLNPKKCYQITE